jgi:hypothetical protein
LKKAASITVNNFTIIPVCRYVIELLSSRFILSIAECRIKGAYDFKQYGTLTYLASFADNASFLRQSLLKKVIKYIRLYTHVFYLLFIKRVEILYTPDLQVLSVVFALRSVFKRNVTIIYHQFELLDPAIIQGKNLKLWKSLTSHVSKIDLCIFPEINRLHFFCEKTGFDRNKCIVFANSCKEGKESDIRPGILQNIADGDLIIAHIGNVGTNHYLSNFLDLAERMGKYNNIHFLMIGRFSSEGIRILKNVNNKNFALLFLFRLYFPN